jgi:enterochelin esterase-like enzyme
MKIQIAMALLMTAGTSGKASDDVGAGKLSEISVEQSIASPKLRSVQAAWRSGNRAATLKFWTDLRTPIIEALPGRTDAILATFVWRWAGLESPVLLDADTNIRWQDGRLRRMGDTDIWYSSLVLPADARILYRFAVVDPRGFEAAGADIDKVIDLLGNAQLDPRNPEGFGVPPQRYSVATMPSAPTALELPPIQQRRAELRLGSLWSVSLGQHRRYTFYRASAPQADERWLLLLLDGQEYISDSFVPTPDILEALGPTGQLPPIDVVFVDSTEERDKELACNPAFSRFLATELLPEIQRHLAGPVPAERTIIGGSSRGGLQSACAALTFPHRFGNVLSLSGSYYWSPPGEPPNAVARAVRQGLRQPIRLFVTVGRFEDFDNPGKPPPSHTNLEFCKALQEKGYSFQFRRFSGGHSYLAWQTELVIGLKSLTAAPPGGDAERCLPDSWKR